MTTRYWIAMAVVCAQSGCFALSSFGNAATHTVRYKKDGFVVEDIRRKFTYDADGPEETAELDGRLKLVDTDGDGDVDVVETQGDEWTRGEPGADEVFADADRKFADTRAYLRIARYKAEWDAMSKAERARAGGADIPR